MKTLAVLTFSILTLISEPSSAASATKGLLSELSEVIQRGSGRLSRKQDLPAFFRQYSSGSKSSQTELTELLISSEKADGIVATVQYRVLDKAGVAKQDPSLLFRLRLEDFTDLKRIEKLVVRKLKINGVSPFQFSISGTNKPGHNQIALGKGDYRTFKSGTTVTVSIDASELSEHTLKSIFRSFDDMAGSGLVDVSSHF
jgi:hypothetical protein